MSLPKLFDREITLKALSQVEAEGNYPSWLNDPIVTQFNSHGEKQYTKEMAKTYIDSVENSSTHHVFAIMFINQHIGNISLQHIDKKSASAELAILIGEPSMYGKGIGYRASKLLFEYGFNVLQLHKIYCGTSEKNVSMQQLALKLGMNEVGKSTRKLYKNNQYFDILEYSILSSQYQ